MTVTTPALPHGNEPLLDDCAASYLVTLLKQVCMLGLAISIEIGRRPRKMVQSGVIRSIQRRGEWLHLVIGRKSLMLKTSTLSELQADSSGDGEPVLIARDSKGHANLRMRCCFGCARTAGIWRALVDLEQTRRACSYCS